MNIEELKAQKAKIEKELQEAEAKEQAEGFPKRKAAFDSYVAEQAKLVAAKKAFEDQQKKVGTTLKNLFEVGGKGPYDLGDGLTGGYTLRTFVNGQLGFSAAIRTPKAPKPTTTEASAETPAPAESPES